MREERTIFYCDLCSGEVGQEDQLAQSSFIAEQAVSNSRAGGRIQITVYFRHLGEEEESARRAELCSECFEGLLGQLKELSTVRAAPQE